MNPSITSVTENTKTSRNKPMNKDFEKLSMAPSPPLSCLSLEVSEMLPQFSTRDSPHCYPPNWTSPYSSTITWIRCSLSFSLLCSLIQCIYKRCSLYQQPCPGPNQPIPPTDLVSSYWSQTFQLLVNKHFKLFQHFQYLLPFLYTDFFSRSCHW